MSTRTVLVTFVLLALASGLPGARAEEGAEDGVLRTRIFDVSALTQGIPNFLRPILALVSPDMVSDEENPLFGAEGEEPRLPLGTLDEIVELIQTEVEPVSWEVTEGAYLRSQGERLLVVRAHRPVLDAIARFLRALEEDVLAGYAIDIRAVRPSGVDGLDRGTLRGGRALEPKEAAALLAKDGLALTLTALANQQAMGFVGRERAYVQDYDVEVAKGSSSSDPIIGIQMTGLAATAKISGGRMRDRLRLRVDAVLSVDGPWQRHASGPSRLIELPHTDVVRAHSQLLLEPGRWYVTQGTLGGSTPGGHAFLVRVRPLPYRPTAREDGADAAWPAADMGPLALRTFDVADLAEARRDVRGPDADLVPSNFTPPEPPELAEPAPIFPQEALVDLLRALSPPRMWNRDGTYLEARDGRLRVKNTAPVLDAVGSQIDQIRRRFLYHVVMDVQAVRASRSLAEALLGADREGREALTARGAQALGAAVAAGEAEILDDMRVVSLAGARNNVLSGRQVAYVQDFEVEIADETDIGNPVVQFVLSGTVVDLQPALTSSRDAALVEVRITRTRLQEPTRELECPFGLLQLPELDVWKLRTNVVAPLDETVVLGLGGQGEDRILLLLRTALKPYDG